MDEVWVPTQFNKDSFAAAGEDKMQLAANACLSTHTAVPEASLNMCNTPSQAANTFNCASSCLRFTRTLSTSY
jgi:hypothetical protein